MIKGVLEEVIPEELQPPQLKAFDSMDDKATFEGVISDDLPPPQLEAFDPSKDKSMPNSPPDEERLGDPSPSLPSDESASNTNLIV